MKTLLSTLGLLAALAGTASAAPYVLPSSQTGNLTTNDWQPVYAIEGIAALDADDDGTDMWGPRFSAGLYSASGGDFTHEFNISVAALFGSTDVIDASLAVESMDSTLIPVTVGYDLYINLVGDLYLDLGANAGYSYITNTVDKWDIDESAGAATFSVGAGLLFKPSEDIYVKVGYEYGRTYFNREDGGILSQHVISLGIGCKF